MNQFYSINDDCSKRVQVHRPLTFIFFMSRSSSHGLEKDLVKKNKKIWKS